MPAQLIDGVALSKSLRTEIRHRAQVLSERHRAPGLAVILVGDDPASQVYVRNKVRACGEAGIVSKLDHLPRDTIQAQLLARIAMLNADENIDGILVQLPLPPHISAQAVIESIAPGKDVDGLQVASAGALLTGVRGFRPCTPLGIMKMLALTGVSLRGANAVVIGRSTSVGKPMALLLLEANATVTGCHSATRDIAVHTRAADIVIAAAGRRNILTSPMIKPGAIIIDVGINRDDQCKLCGDVEFAGAREVAGWISPVPGGVGPMTIAMLLANTVDSAEQTLLMLR